MGTTLEEVVNEYVGVVYSGAVQAPLPPFNEYEFNDMVEHDHDDDCIIITPGVVDTPLSSEEVGSALDLYVADGTSVIFKEWSVEGYTGSVGISTKDGTTLTVAYDYNLSCETLSYLFPSTGWRIQMYPTTYSINQSFMRRSV